MLFTVFTVFRISVRFNWDNGADANFCPISMAIDGFARYWHNAADNA